MDPISFLKQRSPLPALAMAVLLGCLSPELARPIRAQQAEEKGLEKADEKKSYARLNPVVREYFRQRFKDLSILDSFSEDSKAFNKSLDQLIAHHVSEVNRSRDQLQIAGKALAALLIAMPGPSAAELPGQASRHLKNILRQLGRLDSQLDFMRQALALNYRFEPLAPSEGEPGLWLRDLRSILSDLDKLDGALQEFYFSPGTSISFQKLAEEPIPLLIEKIRKRAERLTKSS